MCAACFHEQQDLLQYSTRLQSEPFQSELFQGSPASREQGKDLALCDAAQSCIPGMEKLVEELGVQGILTSGLCRASEELSSNRSRVCEHETVLKLLFPCLPCALWSTKDAGT